MKESTRDIKVYTDSIQMKSLVFLTRNFTISTREGIQEKPM